MEFMKKKIDFRPAIVFSTDPNFSISPEKENIITLTAKEQLLRITLEKKHRAGKTVTLILGFVGTEVDLGDLGKQLKNFCGAGGSAKDGEIIIQGDHREKVKGWLQKNNYRTK